jgi:peptide/nickel transport system substrate-binding protein
LLYDKERIMVGTNGRFHKLISFLVLLVFLLSACGQKSPDTGSTPTPETTVESIPTATPAPRVLTVCLGAEPNTLYPFADPNEAALSVLSAIDDGPIDTIGFKHVPVILQKLPSLADGDVQVSPISVSAGTLIVDANGNLASLASGTPLRPSGCRSDGCVISYDGVSPLKMDQMVVNFRMRTDLTWSDGTPLTADDSVYAYQLAADKSTPGSKYLINRTQIYEATDSSTVQWWGIPGFIDQSFETNFWSPAPKHLWSKFKASELPQIDTAARDPEGWGPYKMQEWVTGDHITLVKNPYYFRASEGLPKFDQLTFRFITDPNAAISELTAGRCDVLDPSTHIDSQVALLQQMQNAGTAQAFFTPGMSIEWLGLGINPATYDDGYDPSKGDRQNILGDPRTRQAIALCLNRQKVVDTVLFGQTIVPASFLPPNHPLYQSGLATYKFDPTTGAQLLDQVGWRDLDGNPATPRQAVSVHGVLAGTQLVLNYYTTQAAQRRQAADILSQSLAQCGIGVNAQYYTQNDLYAPGPVGLLFGRRFDLIQYAMSTDVAEPPCNWFMSDEIPNATNHWVGVNVSGYKNPDYDSACNTARLALPGEPAYSTSYGQAQSIFATDLPSIPLYYRLKVAATRADFCNFTLDPSANPLFNIESYDIGTACKK